jgi:putative ABC transport system substrate-binding protein
MRRREFLTTSVIATLAVPLPVVAKEPARIAVLGSGSAEARLGVNYMTWLRNGLRMVGLVEGQDFTFDVRWANGDYHRFGALAAELIAARPKAIVVSTIAAAEAAREHSGTIPIVMTGLNDPVGAGLAVSIARPGGNITGIATMNEDVIVKLLGLLQSVLPHAKRMIAMVNPTNPSNPVIMATVKREAARLGFTIETFEVPTPAALDQAFEELRRYRPDLLLIVPDNALHSLSEQIVPRALAERVPTVGTSQLLAGAGALVTYGFLVREAVERTGTYLKQILAGASPADLPIEQPTIFQLVVNLNTARALGIGIPAAVLAEADEVVE